MTMAGWRTNKASESERESLSTDRVGNQSMNKIDWGFGMLKIEGIKSSTPTYDNKT
jgi:hypothetical protein